MECPKCEREIKEHEKNCPYCQYDLVNRPKIEKEEKELYKKWCLGGLIAIVVIVIIGIAISSNNTTTTASTNTKNNTDNNTNATEEKVRENPYIITNDYNGTYKFVINNGTNTIVGAINIDGGNLKVKYSNTDTSFTIPIYNGFCGLSKEDNTTFYISVMNSSYETIRKFKCIKSDKNLLGESLTLTNYKNVDFIYVNDSKDIESAYSEVLKQEKEKKEAEQKAKEEQEKQAFIESCQIYTFEQLARNPQNFKGTNVKLTGEVVQVIEGLYSNSLRVNITKKGNYSTYYTDTIYVNYVPEQGEDKILEDDIITIYGTAQGDYSYTSTMGATITLPFVEGKYIIINK